jgi:D-alanyl-D-alanine carboxypeptidase/D-alanyl-D-alanine-endopeptidase (penicillin-binding protein 4)
MSRSSRRQSLAVAVALLVALVACSDTGDSPRTGGTRRAAASRPSTTTTTAPIPTTTTLDLSRLPRCWADDSLWQPATAPPPALAAALATFAGAPGVAGNDVSVSVWVDGLGEVLTLDPDRALAPASNQKLLTAMGALAVIGPDVRLATELRLTEVGDLVVEPGGDATLSSTGPHSLDALAAQVRAAGVTTVAGSLLVDETIFDGARTASGWQDWQIPTYTGPMSAFMVDRNRWRGDAAFLADPALANADRLRAALAAAGVSVAGPTAYAAGPAAGTVVARLESPTVAELVTRMLQVSDNQVADLLVKRIGVAATGVGSVDAASTATNTALEPLCVPLVGHTDDGSGLSRRDARSARELRTLVQVASRRAPWWPVVAGGLPVAGRSGTLVSRLRGTAAEANVRAKTGTLIGGAALTGVGSTASGRAFAFSIIVNGPRAESSAGAIDALVAAVAGDPT